MFDLTYYIDPVMLLRFLPTAFLISILPGMCMTLALALGISYGYRKSLWMMVGELTAVGIICWVGVLGGSFFLEKYHYLFLSIRWFGCGYLLYLGISSWLSKGVLAIPTQENIKVERMTNWQLAVKGFVIAASNPKGWILLLSVFAPFINHDKNILGQGSILVMVFLLIEFICLTIYTLGGKTLRTLLLKQKNVVLLNRISGVLIVVIAVWLVLE